MQTGLGHGVAEGEQPLRFEGPPARDPPCGAADRHEGGHHRDGDGAGGDGGGQAGEAHQLNARAGSGREQVIDGGEGIAEHALRRL
jgi:hypothetical protein